MAGYYTKVPNLYISNEAQSFVLVSLSSADMRRALFVLL